MLIHKFRVVATLILETLREYGMLDICIVGGFVYCVILACLFFVYQGLFDRSMAVVGFMFYFSLSVKMSNFKHKWTRGELMTILSSVTGVCIVSVELLKHLYMLV